ncbi:MAG: hypothetical protein LW710_07040 [Burkholderiales bacterium]|jgi:hypothetical protein|uniref:hypothetical protein n=1 Tax=Limnobacter sp. TaxID=2003368 RepID=UPI0039BC96A7|nr:hypothetical protein [Burkholderiales bacterium]
MKKAARILLILLWVIFATLGLAFVLVRSRIDEKLSESSVLWLYDKFDLLGIEDYQNLLVDFFLGLSFVVVSLLTLLAYFFWCRTKVR